MVQEKVTFVNEESNLSPTCGELEQSPDDEPDQVPGQIKQPDDCMAINEGKVLNENLRSDELSEHEDEIQEVKSKVTNKHKHKPNNMISTFKEDEGNPEIKEVKKILKENLQNSSKEETYLSATLSYFVEKTPCISFSFAFLLLTCVPALTVKTEKKALLLSTSVVLVQLLMVTASPVQITNHTPNEYEYKILQTPLCNGIRFLRPHKCERNEKMFNIYIEFCGFAAMCDPGYKPICIDGDDDEAIYFCSPYNLTCKKGYRRKVRKKEADSDLVIVEEEKCPPGRYQPSESDCYNSCANRHENLEDLPNQYAVYNNGDNASPAMVYCDFHRGFYNPNGKFLTRYDREKTYSSFQCTNVKEHNPCHGVMSPLPDGSCVEPCEAGHSRDVYDNFRCTKNNIVENPEKTATKSGSKDDDGYERFQADDKHEIEWITPVQSENTSTQNWHVTVIKVMVIAALLFTVGSMVVICCTRKGSTCM